MMFNEVSIMFYEIPMMLHEVPIMFLEVFRMLHVTFSPLQLLILINSVHRSKYLFIVWYKFRVIKECLVSLAK